MIPELTTHFVSRSVMSAMARLALAVGATHAGDHRLSTQRSSVGSSVSGTIVTANAQELLVVSARGERVVLDLKARTVVRRDGASSVTVPRGRVATSLARDASPPAATRAELLLWMSSVPWILPLFGLLAIGTAGAVGVVRRIHDLTWVDQSSTRSQSR